MTPWQWIRAREVETRAVMKSGSFPKSVRVFLHADTGFDLDTIVETGLARMLDGIVALVPREWR
ncbi:hypothetical protein GCM10023215_62760 [Pseudonocardia yuanmonensis]|uniref:Uncharacterized protein n=1 Tax=Pseudonocardia yuanmonensis TaxID=1095914 RepID=A0ABP8XS00_9PSEU